MTKYQKFIDSISPDSFIEKKVAVCPFNKEHKIYPHCYYENSNIDISTRFRTIQYKCKDCQIVFSIINSSFMKKVVTPRYKILKIIMFDDAISSKTTANELEVSNKTVRKYRRIYKMEAKLLKDCLDDNEITTFEELKKFYHCDRLKEYEKLKGIKMPRLKDYD